MHSSGRRADEQAHPSCPASRACPLRCPVAVARDGAALGLPAESRLRPPEWPMRGRRVDPAARRHVATCRNDPGAKPVRLRARDMWRSGRRHIPTPGSTPSPGAERHSRGPWGPYRTGMRTAFPRARALERPQRRPYGRRDHITGRGGRRPVHRPPPRRPVGRGRRRRVPVSYAALRWAGLVGGTVDAVAVWELPGLYGWSTAVVDVDEDETRQRSCATSRREPKPKSERPGEITGRLRGSPARWPRARRAGVRRPAAGSLRGLAPWDARRGRRWRRPCRPAA